MEILAENTQLGSGYTIAMRDLEMRGAGEMLGTRQSGDDASILNASLAIPTSVNLPLSIGIPAAYINDQSLRLKLYRRLADIKDEATLASLEMEFEDRFGPLPDQVHNLIYQIKIKLLAAQDGLASVGFEGKQIVLRYPPLLEGVASRDLPELGAGIITGKNAYRIRHQSTDTADWQEILIDVLKKIRSISAS